MIASENGIKMPEFLFDQESKDQYPEDDEVTYVKSATKSLESPESSSELELTSFSKKSEFDSIEETADSEEINLIGGCNYQGQ